MNDYETQALSPTARDLEIRQGIAASMKSPHLLAPVAEINLAERAQVWKQQLIHWKYPSLGLGPVILCIALMGASARTHAQDAAAKSPGSTLTVALPALKPISDTTAVPASPSHVGEPEFISPEVIERARQRLRAKASADRLRSVGAEERSRGDAALETGQHQRALATKLPLPNAVIARTIERIGYACGAVASATALEGSEPGAYKVTCTSGQSYQARPVHGRYHFRRW